LLASSALAGAGLTSSLAMAQAVPVPGGTDLSTLTAPADGTIWSLQGDVTSSAAVTLPTGASGLTINGQGHTLTLNNGSGNYGVLSGPAPTASPVTLTLNGLTLTGGQGVGDLTVGGITYTNAGAIVGNVLTINTDTLTLTNNSALLNSGGGIYTANSLTINGNLTASQNAAGVGGNFGGGVLWTSGTGDITVTGNVTMDSNTATGGAGAIGNKNANVNLATTSGTEVRITNTNGVSGGTGSGAGGGVFAGGSVTIGGSANNNVAVTLTNDNIDQNGGGIYANGSVTINGSLTATGNTAGTVASGIYGGGAIGTNTGNITVTGSVDMENNTAAWGGALGTASANSGDIILASAAGSNVTVLNNTATNIYGGGALETNGGNVVIGNSTTNPNGTVIISNNTSADQGGAIWAYLAVSITGNAITLSQNQSSASTAGGAIYSDSGNVSLNGDTVDIEKNITGTNGGAIMAFSGNVSVGNVGGGAVTVTGNTSSGNGGAIAAGGTTTLNGGAITISDNTALATGGAILGFGDVTIGDASSTLTMTGNKAGTAGGAIWSNGNVTLFGTDISNNTAVGNGGAVNATGNFSLTATTNDTIANNTAGGNGGAIWAGGNVTLNAANGNIAFSGNTANGAANAIYINNTASGVITTLNAASGHTITFFDPIQSNGAINVSVTGGGAVTFDGSQHASAADQRSDILAATTVSGNGTTLLVSNGAVYGAAGSTLAVQAGATLGGNGTVTGNTTNSGVVAPSGASASAAATLTINGNYAGSGSVDIDVLRSGADVLAINGVNNGAINVQVTNTSGLGRATTGDGILVVQTNGVGSYALLNAPLTVGAYTYTLEPGSSAATANNLYLRATFTGVTGAAAIPALNGAGLALLALLLAAATALPLPLHRRER
jgi:predicted outer membrane repeat protein